MTLNNCPTGERPLQEPYKKHLNQKETRKQKIKTRSYPAVRETISKKPNSWGTKKEGGGNRTVPSHAGPHVADRWGHASASLQCVSNPRSLPYRHKQPPNKTANVVPLAAPSPRAGESKYPPFWAHRTQDEHQQAYITGTSI